MLKSHLPNNIEPLKLAYKKTNLTGFLLLADMTRLTSMLAKEEGEVSIDLHFGIDPNGLAYVKGKVSTNVVLICQRCLQAFSYELTSNVHLSMVKTDLEAKELSSEYEPLLLNDGFIELNELVQDELILALPIVSMHELSDCNVQLISTKPEKIKASPFDILKSFNKE